MSTNARQAGFVRRVEISERVSPCFDGLQFDARGPYERLHGTAYCEVDPEHPLNAGIVNLGFAPRNAHGRVEYDFDICIVKPVDLTRGNGWLFYEILNRGGKRSVPRINHAPNKNLPLSAADAGNGFLMRQGYSMVWGGWQSDVSPGNGRMVARYPVARDGNRKLTALCREEYINETPAETFTGQLSYPAANQEAAKATLTVRLRERDPRQTPPDLRWRYLNDRQIEITRSRDPRFDRGAIYEFIYPACDPVVTGLAFTGTRDFATFLRHDAHDAEGNANPLAVDGVPHARRALVFGLSQSGRAVRDFLHQGFNEAPRGGRVFDAAIPLIAGSRRTFINHAFAQPGRYSRQHEDHSYPDDQFPFTYATLTDPVSGRSGGILDRCTRTGTAPKIMHLDTDSEIWSARASLVATDTLGHDIAMPENVRLYLAAGLQHGWSEPPPPGVGQFPDNPVSYGCLARALIVAMREWVEAGTEPPPSCFPSRAAGTLVESDPAHSGFPAIPGVRYTGIKNELRLMDYSHQPPREGPAYPVYVVKFDPDGNATDGICHPLIATPLATHTGWNLRSAGHAEGDLFSVIGAMLPFARDAASRDPADPRPSLVERYGTHAAWRAQLTDAARALVAARYLLQEDADRLIAAAGTSWETAQDVFTAV
ncbi:MAG: alpha/beta hydrolase domain-containing protein [Burkholderiales bacterium]